MSMITAMYIAFSILMAFAVFMAWWSVRQETQEKKEREQQESKSTTASKKRD